MSTKPEQWAEAKRRCRLSDDDIRKAKELGMQPKSLIKNIPSPSQRWKASVRDWVQSLHAEKFGVRVAPPTAVAPTPVARPKMEEPRRVLEFRNPEHPWPDRPPVPDRIVDLNLDFDEAWESHGPPDESDIAETTTLMIRKQYLFRWGAQSVAIVMSRLPEVRKVAAFGAIAQPLRMEVPRFGQYRKYRIEALHECADIDLAVWLDDFSRLKQVKRAITEGLKPLQNTPYGGIPHHQVDLHVFDAASGLYRGRVCIFSECPKPGKRECQVPNCGEQPFLQQFDNFHFDNARFELEPKVTLFDRADGFLVRPPRVEDAKRSILIERNPDGDDSDDEVSSLIESSFAPIGLEDYLRLFLKNNPGEKAGAVRARLRGALEAKLAGEKCQCGEPIWVVGSAEAGRACFTCITGEAEPDSDYEISEA